MKKLRRHFSDPEKVAILKRHLLDKVPISDLCDELDLYPNQVYDWLKKFFENGHLAFASSRGGRQAKAAENAQHQKVELAKHLGLHKDRPREIKAAPR